MRYGWQPPYSTGKILPLKTISFERNRGARREGRDLSDDRRPGVYLHTALTLCCQSSSEPETTIACSTKLGRNTGACFALGDSYDPEREGSKITPEADEIPQRYD